MNLNHDRIGAVMVVGAGVSGIQTSLDLANSSFRVYLVDEAPSIGGKMAQLDKTFPTNDCSMCILSPKFIECERNLNIEIITNTKVDKVEGEAGDFRVTLLKKPRYVEEEKCTGCGTCAEYCPVKISDPFNENLSLTRCIHTPFPQAIPAVSIVDPSQCLFLLYRQCKICAPVCKNKAINLYQKEQEIEIEVGAIILAPGYERFDPKLKGGYGYGVMKNVVTGLEFERILSAAGPYRGEVSRLSDGRHPKRIAWIQCVGSRDIAIGNGYCSAVCCMYAIKQVIMACEHDPELEATIFYNDIRAFGKGFEAYYERAKRLPGVRFIWGIASIVKELPQTKNLLLRYCPNDAEVREEEFDLVVLSVGLNPSPGARELAQRLRIELNPYGFCQTNNFSPIETSRRGIYVSGVFRSPMDIPESVMTASAAASLSSQLLSTERGTLVIEKEYPPERDVSGEKPKVGVFVCHCGTNIARVVDVSSVVRYANSIDDVVYAEENLFSCSADSVRHIGEVIQEEGLNRVVVAACTPRTHEPLFQETLREAGLNPYLFEMANIREHCSWVHMRDKDKATAKAKELVKMAVAKARLLQPLKRISLPLNHSGLVIGGGISGMESALSLAEQGFEVYLVEKASRLGGIARRIYYILEGGDVQDYLENLIHRVYENPLIHVYTNANILEVSGYVGNFTTKISMGKEVEEVSHGIAIIATGGEEYEPTEYLYGKDPRVLTLLELEEEIAQGNSKVTSCRSLVIIQCVGSRSDERPYCSRVCCGQSIKCALKLKEINPEIDIYILHQDMRTYGFKEDYYREAANRRVNFIRFDPQDKPEVEIIEEGGGNILRVIVADVLLGKQLMLDADILALGVAIIPSADNKILSQLFKVPLNQDGFFLEAHMKLRPVDFATDGIFMCGLAHSPKFIEESIAQAQAAASRAAGILSQKQLEAAGITAYVDWEKCIGCGICKSLCPFGAIELKTVEQEVKAEIITASCKGCGLCSTHCPRRAITIGCFTDEQIISQICALEPVHLGTLI
jgi:heterodisulfide reductase subunit A